ncbi:MAG: type B 50S ribosomal protein L31 [Planctomycetes bacterium]|jgi:large subunit ribosomal protein L31|nr:type B 50S ribosomal protein L31 [Planctomycetota bacterium]
MKKGIHPESYRYVVFQDRAAGFTFLTRSTIKTTDKITWEDGKEYPLFNLDISSASHPFYTGRQKFVDAAGRVEKFRRKYQGAFTDVSAAERDAEARAEAEKKA